MKNQSMRITLALLVSGMVATSQAAQPAPANNNTEKKVEIAPVVVEHMAKNAAKQAKLAEANLSVAAVQEAVTTLTTQIADLKKANPVDQAAVTAKEAELKTAQEELSTRVVALNEAGQSLPMYTDYKNNIVTRNPLKSAGITIAAIAATVAAYFGYKYAYADVETDEEDAADENSDAASKALAQKLAKQEKKSQAEIAKTIKR